MIKHCRAVYYIALWRNPPFLVGIDNYLGIAVHSVT